MPFSPDIEALAKRLQCSENSILRLSGRSMPMKLNAAERDMIAAALRAFQPATPTGGEKKDNTVVYCTHPDYSDWDGSQPEPRSRPSPSSAGIEDALPKRPDSIYSKYHLENWSDVDFANHTGATRKTVAYLIELEAAIAAITLDVAQPPAKPVKITEDQIMQVIRKVTSGGLREMLTCKRWKDGIDIDQPTFAAERLAEEFGALAISSTDRQNIVASEPSPENMDPKPEPLA